MDTEIKSTLFRFVNFRSPELITDVETNPGFVIQKSEDIGVFNAAIQSMPVGSTKATVLRATADNFASQALTVNSLKALNTGMYHFSVWLAKNKKNATETEIQNESAKVTNKNISLVTIWNNLFYQIISQSDFYAKEVLMQLLVAHHVCNASNGTFKDRALASVVLPENVFTDKSKLTNKEQQPTSRGEVPFANPVFQKLEKQVVAKENIQVLKQLQKELKEAEKIYNTEYQDAYQNSYKTFYEKSVKPELDNYQSKIEAATASYCANANPNIPHDPNNPCHQPPSVPFPSLPEFEFSFREPLEDAFLSGFLSSQSYNAFRELVNPTTRPEDEGALLGGYSAGRFQQFSTYQSADDSINNMLNSEFQEASLYGVDSGSTSLVVGGSLFDVPNTQSPLQPFEYEIKTRNKGLNGVSTLRLQIMLGIPSSAWEIDNVQYKMTRADDTFETFTASGVTHFSGYDALLSLNMTGITNDLKEFHVTFQFKNGKTASATIENFSLSSIYKDFVQFPRRDSDVNQGSAGNTSAVEPIKSFIPKSFGIKQIGIADYNKVEQSIQGYIEGEVSHIENIMAREFKEKNTRRTRKSEVSESRSYETEKEQLTDTTTTDRFEMHNEVAKVIANSKDFNAGIGVNANYKFGTDNSLGIQSNLGFATHNSTEESNIKAQTVAKEITERALERVVNKVREERIEKIIEEFEENNSHGFDNRKGDKHVVGVYRWVDKVYKNQIVNYGKRIMFEFSIPEPARLHNLAMQALVNQKKANPLPVPQDPRTDTVQPLRNYADLDNESILKHWTGIYNVKFEPKPLESIEVSTSFEGRDPNFTGGDDQKLQAVVGKGELEIPDGYLAKTASYSFGTYNYGFGGSHVGYLTIASKKTALISTHQIEPKESFISGFNVKTKLAYSFSTIESPVITGTIRAQCDLSIERKSQWQQQTFNAIIAAYEEALKIYNEKVAEAQENGVKMIGTNPGFYREIENTILRKNCISYLISSDPDASRTFGKDFYIKNNNEDDKLTFDNAMINQTAALDDYAAFVKFIEQAFEWDIMSYYFYPFYWGSSDNWGNMYQYDQTNDPIFKAFMQSGMASVIVTVRPGFEEAVSYYMQTGQIWSGGEVPKIGDQLYLSIVEQMRKTVGEKVGRAWPTRVPTSMTILQADSIGLIVDRALPFNTDLSDFENQDEVPQSSQILQVPSAQIGGLNPFGTARVMGIISGNNGIQAKIVLKTIAGVVQDMTYCDANGNYELNNLPASKFELFLDANNDFPSDTHEVTVGAKQLVVELTDGQTIEVNLTVALIS